MSLKKRLTTQFHKIFTDSLLGSMVTQLLALLPRSMKVLGSDLSLWLLSSLHFLPMQKASSNRQKNMTVNRLMDSL